jgi:hypothetical protein
MSSNTFLVVKKDMRGTEHDNLDSACIEAGRLSAKLHSEMYIVKLIGRTVASIPIWPENHYKPWTAELDGKLLQSFMGGDMTPSQLARKFGRTTKAIVMRLESFQLDCYGPNDCYRGW